MACQLDRGQTDVIIMDFRNAFDKVSQMRLLYPKVLEYETKYTNGSFLCSRNQEVIIDGCFSDEEKGVFLKDWM